VITPCCELKDNTAIELPPPKQFTTHIRKHPFGTHSLTHSTSCPKQKRHTQRRRGYGTLKSKDIKNTDLLSAHFNFIGDHEQQ